MTAAFACGLLLPKMYKTCLDTGAAAAGAATAGAASAALTTVSIPAAVTMTPIPPGLRMTPSFPPACGRPLTKHATWQLARATSTEEEADRLIRRIRSQLTPISTLEDRRNCRVSS